MASTVIQENRPGRIVLGRYELLEQIGRGGFSTVYRAYDHKMGREVAVKAVRRTEELTDRATREARAAAKLSHPHIVTVFELSEDDHEVYIVSELVRGSALRRQMDSVALSDRDCLEIILQVLEALAEAHAAGVIHRDIKPDNIMLAGGAGPPRAKVMDFGIAQLEDTRRITRRGDVVGTLSYMSPEQADGRPVDSATDVYSAALTLYECLAGTNPFRAATAAETVGRIQAGAPPLSQVRPDLPAELAHLVEEAMDPDPRLRLGLRSFAAGLEEIISGLSAGDQATSVIRRADMPKLSVYEEVTGRYGFLAARAANAALPAMISAAAAYGSDFYPAHWRLPLVFGAALLVGLLPRVGLLGLAAVGLLPVMAYSVALGALCTVAVAVYFLTVGLTSPRVALLPAAAGGLGFLGLGLVYPAVAGSIGRLRRGLLLALLGGATFTLFQLFSGAQTLDYLDLPNDFGIRAALAAQYNPAAVLTSLAEPFRAQPVLLLQPVIWLAAAVPAAILIRRRSLLGDFAGLIMANALLLSGYFALPRAVAGYSLAPGHFLKTFVLCAIIQVGLLLISPRATRLRPIPPRERTEET